MSNLLARIMLALLMLPAAALLYTAVMAVAFEVGPRNEELAFTITTVIVMVFVAAYWTLLWRRTVRWSARRLRRTGLAVAVATGAGIGLGLLGLVVARGFSIFIGGFGAIVLGLILTTLAWRETPEERADRVRATGAGDGVACPTCGYNMTGLRQALCPECGASFTLDEFLALQSDREAKELEGHAPTETEAGA